MLLQVFPNLDFLKKHQHFFATLQLVNIIPYAERILKALGKAYDIDRSTLKALLKKFYLIESSMKAFLRLNTRNTKLNSVNKIFSVL